ncbi:MAG TPA: twin-arginine translocation signal domain-containing protein [Gemmatimonadota bacterium]|nr:twin-arginine translocation signal domain-containing protein [Gemmatimonadota bacterium]
MSLHDFATAHSGFPDTPRGFSRRDFLKSSLAVAAACAIPGCDSSTNVTPPGDPRLTATPGSPTIAATLGLTALEIAEDRDGLLYVPEGYTGDVALPLLVLLHGASGDARFWLDYRYIAEERDVIILMPDSRSATWDLIYGAFDSDVVFLDRALQHTFDRCLVDPEKVALGGFSDGATYALSLGVSNGGLFTHLVAYSPGFFVHAQLVGRPKVLVSHGTEDTVLPVAGSRDGIVPELRDLGYDVTYKQFDGGHEIPGDIRVQSFNWLLRAD